MTFQLLEREHFDQSVAHCAQLLAKNKRPVIVFSTVVAEARGTVLLSREVYRSGWWRRATRQRADATHDVVADDQTVVSSRSKDDQTARCFN